MQRSVLEQLGQQQVPERPAELRRQMHERLNARLVGVQLVEVAVRVLPIACIQFLEALCGAVAFTLTGQYPKQKQQGDNHAERNDSDS